MRQFSKVTYIVVFQNSQKESIQLSGIEALARFASNDLYTVTGFNGRMLTNAEMDAWESLTETLFDTVESLPVGAQNGTR